VFFFGVCFCLLSDLDVLFFLLSDIDELFCLLSDLDGLFFAIVGPRGVHFMRYFLLSGLDVLIYAGIFIVGAFLSVHRWGSTC
jgi:hypothetical protein